MKIKWKPVHSLLMMTSKATGKCSHAVEIALQQCYSVPVLNYSVNWSFNELLCLAQSTCLSTYHFFFLKWLFCKLIIWWIDFWQIALDQFSVGKFMQNHLFHSKWGTQIIFFLISFSKAIWQSLLEAVKMCMFSDQ